MILFHQFSYAQHNFINYSITMEGAVGNGEYTPTYLSSNRHGVMPVETNTGFVRAAISANKRTRHLLWQGEADIQIQKDAYQKWYLQQLYLSATYGWITLTIGSKEYEPIVRNFALSSGSTVWSGNSRPIPQARLATNGFVTIPGTKEWIQVYFDGSYGYYMDGDYQKQRFSEYSIGKSGYGRSFITTNVCYHQKKIYFRTNPNKKFILTAGMEHAVQFGGKHINYIDPNVSGNYKVKIGDFFKVLKPTAGGSNAVGGDKNFALGNHIGNISIDLEYKFNSTKSVKTYVENLFEDGSSLGKRNGWDGLWGIEFCNEEKAPLIKGIVLEYLQTTDQSGPIHWAPSDFSHEINQYIPAEARGADDYYNNFFYNGYSHYGMSSGSPVLKSPIYNNDSFLRFTDTRVRAYHLGILGYISTQWQYRLLISHRDAWGTPYTPSLKINSASCAMAEIKYFMQSWQFKAAVGLDRGSLFGDNTAFNFAVCKRGNLLSK